MGCAQDAILGKTTLDNMSDNIKFDEILNEIKCLNLDTKLDQVVEVIFKSLFLSPDMNPSYLFNQIFFHGQRKNHRQKVIFCWRIINFMK